MERFYYQTDGETHFIMATSGLGETVDDVCLANPRTAEMAVHLVGRLNECMDKYESEEE